MVFMKHETDFIFINNYDTIDYRLADFNYIILFYFSSILLHFMGFLGKYQQIQIKKLIKLE